MKKFIIALFILSSVTLLGSCTVTTTSYTPGYQTVGYQANYWGNRYYYPAGYRYYRSYNTRLYIGQRYYYPGRYYYRRW